MGEKMRDHYKDDSEEENQSKELNNENPELDIKEELRLFVDSLRKESLKYKFDLGPDNDVKAGLPFEGLSDIDIEDKKHETKEIVKESILEKSQNEIININLIDKLIANLDVFEFQELSRFAEEIDSFILELDPTSPLKQKLLQLKKELLATMRLKGQNM